MGESSQANMNVSLDSQSIYLAKMMEYRKIQNQLSIMARNEMLKYLASQNAISPELQDLIDQEKKAYEEYAQLETSPERGKPEFVAGLQMVAVQSKEAIDGGVPASTDIVQ